MKQSLRGIIRDAVRGRIVPRPRRRQPDPNLPHPMYRTVVRRSGKPLTQIRAWAGGLTLGAEVLARHPERNGEGAAYIRSERKKRKRRGR